MEDAAIAKNPGSEKLPELITGSTKAEIERSAAAATECVHSLAQDVSGPGLQGVGFEFRAGGRRV